MSYSISQLICDSDLCCACKLLFVMTDMAMGWRINKLIKHLIVMIDHVVKINLKLKPKDHNLRNHNLDYFMLMFKPE